MSEFHVNQLHQGSIGGKVMWRLDPQREYILLSFVTNSDRSEDAFTAFIRPTIPKHEAEAVAKKVFLADLGWADV